MAEQQKRQYVVLVRESDVWVEVKRIAAMSSEQAIRNAVGSEGTFVAVPERNFRPVKVSVEQPKPRIVLGDGEAEESKETA